MDKFDRAVRRHHVVRLKSKRKYYWGYGSDNQQLSQSQLGKVVQYPCACSCCMCGNPRRIGWSHKRTLKEISHLEIEQYERKEVYHDLDFS